MAVLVSVKKNYDFLNLKSRKTLKYVKKRSVLFPLTNLTLIENDNLRKIIKKS